MPGRRTRRSRRVTVFDQQRPIYDCVVVEVNTQRDFLFPDGVLRIANRQLIMENLKKLIQWANEYRLPVVSPVDAHRPGGENIRSPLFHCIDGTPGQQKVSFTLLPRRYTIKHDASVSLPDDLLEHHRQVIVHKRTNDVFTNPKADTFFSKLQAKRFIVFGVGAERAIKSLVLGLMTRGKRVFVVRDACGWWDRRAYIMAMRQMEAKGAIMMDAEDLLATEPDTLPMPVIEIKPIKDE